MSNGDGRVIFIACPVCCMSRPLVKTGSRAVQSGKIPPGSPGKGKITFDAFNLEHSYVLQVRQAGGSLPASGDDIEDRQLGKVKGRGKTPGLGFRTVDGLTLEKMKDNPEYIELIEQLKNQCIRIINILS